ncbi:MAG TPA: aminopeptidase, partial [Opitutus sp.]|nr:aminopeptidase [Opitutus sp.]
MLIDPRFTQLAQGLTGFSTTLKKGERVLIDAFDVPDAIVVALIRATRARGAEPFVQIHRARIARELTLQAVESQVEVMSAVELARMQK